MSEWSPWLVGMADDDDGESEATKKYVGGGISRTCRHVSEL